jgi:integrase
MGTIVKRPRKGGGVGYLAQISIMREGKIVFRQSRTFDRERIAAAWIAKRESELAKPGALSQAAAGARATTKTLADAIDRYSEDTLRAPGRTKTQVLRTIKTHNIASMRCEEITSRDIVAFAQKLGETAAPQTVNNYLSHLSSVFAIARPAWGFDLDQQAMADALKVAKRLGLTAKSRERSRRPTLDELDSIMNHFATVRIRRPETNPMQLIIAFAIFSTRRLEEITRIQWSDLDGAGSRVMVRDMKNPGEKMGNDVWCDLPPEALRIVMAMPFGDGAIFPFGTDGISAAFTRACKLLAISDLHFHDLRHDGVSRLFELGWNIPHVAAVSGHRSWQSLKRYTHLRQTGDMYAGWPWLERLATSV